MRKKPSLGTNPLNPDAVLRDMVRGGRGHALQQQEGKAAAASIPTVRKTPSTTTPGGLLRKTVYFTETEWRAIRTKAYLEDRPYTDIVREAVRGLLNVD